MKVKLSDLKQGPLQHTSLPPAMVTRILYLHKTFGPFDKQPIETWLENFQCDVHPEREVLIWESMARVFHAVLDKYPHLDKDAQFEVYAILLASSTGSEDGMRVGYLSTEEATEVQRLWAERNA